MILNRFGWLVCVVDFYNFRGVETWQMREAEAVGQLILYIFLYFPEVFVDKTCQDFVCWDVWRGATRCTFESTVLIMQPVFVVRTWHNEKATNMGEKKDVPRVVRTRQKSVFIFYFCEGCGCLSSLGCLFDIDYWLITYTPATIEIVWCHIFVILNRTFRKTSTQLTFWDFDSLFDLDRESFGASFARAIQRS